MFHKEKPDYNRNRYGFYTLDQLVPEDHFLRQVDKFVDFDFIYHQWKILIHLILVVLVLIL